MKIEPSIKYRNLPAHFKEHLSFFNSFVVKQIIAAFTFIGLDLAIILPLIFPKVNLVLYLTVPLLIFINAWAIRLLIADAAKTELESVLFLGTLGGVGSFCYFVLVQKMNIYVLQNKSPLFILLSIVAYCLIITFFIYNQKKKFTLSKFKAKKETSAIAMKIAWYAIPLGYILVQILSSYSSYLLHSFMMLVYSGLLIFFTSISVKFLHRYFFMRANVHLLSFSGRKSKEV